MKIEVSVGEIIDKLTILSIKRSFISDPKKLENIEKEYQYLQKLVLEDLQYDINDSNYINLFKVNLELWHIEDAIRKKEFNREFDSVFIELARSVYITNDKRATIKKIINFQYNSELTEEKSYAHY